jgi:hypothetical protein
MAARLGADAMGNCPHESSHLTSQRKTRPLLAGFCV